MTKHRVKARRKVNTYVVLWAASWNALKQAEASETGRYFNAMSISLYCALTLEAYFNHIGALQIPEWNQFERIMGPRDKLKKLTAHFGIRPNYQHKPWKTFDALMIFRNDLAHGKSLVMQADSWEAVAADGVPKKPAPRWEKLCSLPAAINARADTRAMIEQLHTCAGIDHDPFWNLGLITWEIHPALPIRE